MHQRQLVGHERPCRGIAGRGHIRHVTHLFGQLLGDGAREVVVVEVENHHRPRGNHAGRKVVRCVHAGPVEFADGKFQGRKQHMRPTCSGGNDHVSMFQTQYVVDAELAARIEVHVRPLAQLSHAPIGHAPPCRKSRQPGLEAQASAELLGGIREGHLVAAARQRDRALEPGRAAADDQDGGIAGRRRESFGVPVPAPFFAGGRVLRAAHRDAVVPAGDADVAADALANLVFAALVDLARQKRVGDGRTRAADKIQDAAFDLRHHDVRRGEAADADHRLLGDLLDEVDDGFVAALGCEARRRAIGGTRIHLHVPEIGNLAEQRHDLVRFRRQVLARFAAQFFQADAQRHAALVADGVAGDFQELAHQSDAVLDGTAVAVGPMIVFGQQEFIGQIPHAGIDVHDVEAGLHGAPCAGGLPLQEIADIAGIHGAWAQIAHEAQMSGEPRHPGRRERCKPAGTIQSAGAAVPEFDAGKSAVFMHRIRHQGVSANVPIVP